MNQFRFMAKYNRRNFFKLCGVYLTTLTALKPTSPNAAPNSIKRYNTVSLVRNGYPVRPEDLASGQAYIFNYPYLTTPCIVFDLGEPTPSQHELNTETGMPYVWDGGVGPKSSIVAYSAICAHRMTYPAKTASFLNYRHGKAVYFDNNRTRQEKEKIIYCCSERSVYDPKAGAKVIGGPAPQPLASIQLDVDPIENTLSAYGTIGGEMFDQFLEKFEFRLKLDFNIADIRQLTQGQAELMTVEEYSDFIVHC